MRRNDWIWLGAVLAAAAVFWGIYIWHQGNAEADCAVVLVDGEEYGSYPLNEDAEISINGTNELVIRNHEADMVAADCPDQICVNQRPAGKNGETIVCLPNKIVVEIHSSEEAEVDSVAN